MIYTEGIPLGEERTAKFGEDVIIFAKSIKKDVITRPLISQIVRSATSIGVPINRDEADGAESKKDFPKGMPLAYS